jgi:hypothetical protein
MSDLFGTAYPVVKASDRLHDGAAHGTSHQ